MISDNMAPEIIRAIKGWLSQYRRKAMAKRYIVGVSGGVDSAVVATLCAETDEPCTFIGMPCGNSDEQNRNMALMLESLSKYKNVTIVNTDLSQLESTFMESIGIIDPKGEHNERWHLARANLISRLRMCVLYYHANLTQGLVVGTGNFIEDSVLGFFTKYGDGGVDVSPIGSFYKSEVYQLADQFANIIPAEIINAAPTDGLWEDARSDEDQMGFSYNMAELFWEYKDMLIETWPRSAVEKLSLHIPKILHRHMSNLHKMKLPPRWSDEANPVWRK